MKQLVMALGLIGGAVAPSAAAGAPPPPAGTQVTKEIRSVDNDAAGKCLDVYDWGNGPWIQMWACHGGANQRWTVKWIKRDEQGYDIVSFVNAASGKCIDAYRGPRAQLAQYSCDSTGDQSFRQYFSNIAGVYHFRSVLYPTQCMDVYDWGRGTAVQLWDCHWGPNQAWDVPIG